MTSRCQAGGPWFQGTQNPNCDSLCNATVNQGKFSSCEHKTPELHSELGFICSPGQTQVPRQGSSDTNLSCKGTPRPSNPISLKQEVLQADPSTENCLFPHFHNIFNYPSSSKAAKFSTYKNCAHVSVCLGGISKESPRQVSCHSSSISQQSLTTLPGVPTLSWRKMRASSTS